MTENDIFSIRYDRQILLPQLGRIGQEKLSRSSVMVAGCGALGSHVANILTRAGVGQLLLVDRDHVEISNLHRQVLFSEQDALQAVPKADAARNKLIKINSLVDVIPVNADLNRDNIHSIVFEKAGRKIDLIIDGLDNFETRFLLNDAAVKWGIPYIYAGAVSTSGSGFSILPHTVIGDSLWEKQGFSTPCLRCLFNHTPPTHHSPTCDHVGVLGPIVGVVANMESAEAMKILTQDYKNVCRDLWDFDVWNCSLQHFKVSGLYASNNCSCCKRHAFQYLDGH